MSIGKKVKQACSASFALLKQCFPMPPRLITSHPIPFDGPTLGSSVSALRHIAEGVAKVARFGVEILGDITPGVRMTGRRRLPQSFSAGIIGAEVATWAAIRPSLLPRPWWVTATNVGLSQATGHFLATTIVFSARSLHRLINRFDPSWAFLGGSYAPVSVQFPRLPARVSSALHLTLGAITVAAMLRAVRDQKEQAQLVGISYSRTVLGGASGAAIGVGLGTAGYGAALVLGELIQLSIDRLSRQYSRILPVLVAWPLAGLTFFMVLAALSDRVVIRRAIARASVRAQQANRLIFPGSTMPWEPERTGSPWSYEPFTALGSQGRSFVSAGPRAGDIAKLMGLERAMEPIRIYVGTLPGRSTAGAVERVLAEMNRTGAFRRDSIVIHMPAGSGWLNNWSVSAPEFLTGGNCASVSMQYSVLPSALSYVVDKTAPLTAAAALIQAIRRRLQLLPADDRPKLYLAGESLGAYAILDSFSNPTELLQACDGAVLTGAPRLTQFFSHLRRDSNSLVRLPVVDAGQHFRFALTPQHLHHDAYGTPYAAQWQRPRVVLGQHASDPIVWWDWPLLFRRPSWMREPQPPTLYADTFPHLHWAPFITFWQVGIDQINSLSVPGGHGHNYHAELLWYWAQVLGSQAESPLNADLAKRLTQWLYAHPAKLPFWP